MLKNQFFPVECEETTDFIALSIKERRADLRLRQADLAVQVGVSLATLRKIERGDPAVAMGSVLHVLWHLGLLSTMIPVDGHRLPDTASRARRVRLPMVRQDEF